MIDRIFFAALTFSLMITGSVAIGAGFVGVDQRAASASKGASAAARVVQLERVVVVGKRIVPVNVIARVEPGESSAARVQ